MSVVSIPPIASFKLPADKQMVPRILEPILAVRVRMSLPQRLVNSLVECLLDK